MTVAELIKFLHEQPQDLQVAIKMYSEYCLLDKNLIEVKEHCETRPDGWIQYFRPDKPTQKYLCFLGN